MKERFIENGIEYVKNGDYYLPNFALPDKIYSIGKYGMMRRRFLKNRKRSLYSALLISGKLNEHLHEVDVQAQTILEQFIKSGEKDAPNKATEQMKWIGYMNNLKHSAEEVINHELIYV